MPPLFMKSISLTLQAEGQATPVEFNCNVRIATIEVEAGDVVTFEPLCEDGAYSESEPPTYAMHLVGAQDWTSNTVPASIGLARYLDDFAGLSAAFEFQAHGQDVAASADQPAKAGTLILQAPSYGGEKSTYAELDVSMPIVGKPTNVVAPTAFRAAGRAAAQAMKDAAAPAAEDAA
jgi:hypothetical protein